MVDNAACSRRVKRHQPALSSSISMYIISRVARCAAQSATARQARHAGAGGGWDARAACADEGRSIFDSP